MNTKARLYTERNARVWMARLGCGGGGDGAHRSTRSCIKFHGAEEKEEEAGIVPRGLDTKFHGADVEEGRMGG